MAEYVAVPLNIKLHRHKDCLKELGIRPKDLRIQIRRKCYAGYCKVTEFSSWNICLRRSLRFTHAKKGQDYKCRNESSLKCYCLGSLITPDGASTSDWIPGVDQVLLMATMFLTYVAGVVPAKQYRFKSPKSIANDYAVPEDTSFSGSTATIDNEVNLKFAWDIVNGKLTDCLNAIAHKGNFGNGVLDYKQDNAKRPSSLYAVSEGPRFRLLWASFQWLREEVDNTTRNSGILIMDDPLMIFSEIILKSGQPICTTWLKEELYSEKSKPDKALISMMVEKLNGYDSILQNIKKSGKEDLYAELICVLRFGSLRQGCCYDKSFFTLHAVSVLEDLVITLADGIASMYLELISVDGDISNDMSSLGLSLCTLSTRALQRLRNEVALSQWMYQNMEAVVSMYEDRFDLRTLQRQLIEEPSKREMEKFSWWKKLGLRKSGTMVSPLRFFVISYITIPVKRTKELRALTGWRYYYSLFLELADITMPLIRTVIAKVSDGVSFFLVCLIGRSLGLIYTGIREALRWK
ncbi:hypothetical protein LguiA_020621 [Lonicera macranthoides]